MKVGDLVKHSASAAFSGTCAVGMIVKIGPVAWGLGAMVLWDHGEICYAPLEELEVLSEVGS